MVGEIVMTSSGTYTTEVRVPEVTVGFVIGKGGSNIQLIRQTTNVHVVVGTEQPDGSDRIATVTGPTRQSVYHAVCMISQKINRSSSHTESSQNMSLDSVSSASAASNSYSQPSVDSSGGYYH